MSSSRGDHYYTSVTKSRRGSFGDAQGGVYLQTGHSSFQTQGGRTVLPPLSSAFPTSHFPASNLYPTPYSQPRSSPGRNDYVSAMYAPWPGTTPPLQPLANSFPFYEPHEDRYPAQPAYGSSYSTRSTTPTIPSDQHSSCRLPPLTVLTTPERWQSAPYPMAVPSATHMPHPGTSIRSPTATYPYPYPQAESYSYPAVQDTRDGHPVAAMSHQSQVMHMQHSSLPSRPEGRSSQPRTQSALSSGSYSSIPGSVVVNEEPVIKKKRKRADANQLKVLNEVYSRTAFPSTEERAELARKLDMSARSVQIWFQNKRQAMRQSSRQSSGSTQSSNQPFSVSPQPEALSDVAPYTQNIISLTSLPDPPYLPRSNVRLAVPHPSQASAPHHCRPRSQEDTADHYKWSHGY